MEQTRSSESEMPGSNVRGDTGYHDVHFRSFPQTLQANSRITRQLHNEGRFPNPLGFIIFKSLNQAMLAICFTLTSDLAYLSTLKMEATCSSKCRSTFNGLPGVKFLKLWVFIVAIRRYVTRGLDGVLRKTTEESITAVVKLIATLVHRITDNDKRFPFVSITTAVS
jgi:hypothetical protein